MMTMRDWFKTQGYMIIRVHTHIPKPYYDDEYGRVYNDDDSDHVAHDT